MISVNKCDIEVKRFPDGTLLLKDIPVNENSDVAWFYEGDEELITLVYIVNHLKTHGAKTVCLYMPYIPNARQDRVKTESDVFTLKYFAQIINALKMDKVIVLDPHSSVSEALIENIVVQTPKDIVSKIYDELCRNFGEDITVFYPDEGAMKRYSGMLRAPYTFGIKNRDWATGNINGLSVSGDIELIKGKNILIVDDICSRGCTFYHSAKKLKELGANEIFLYVTHCENTILEGDVLTCGLISRVYTTNSIFTKEHERITVIKL